MKLADQQRLLSHWIRNPEAHPLTGVQDRPGRSAPEAAKVYRDSVYETHLKALAIQFPVTQRLLGERPFRNIGKRYLDQNPSRTPHLSDFGAAFPNFLARFSPLRDWPYLSDTARLERLHHEALEARDGQAFDWGAFQTAANRTTRIRFHLAPHCSLLDSPFPIDRIWQANQEDIEEVPVVDLAEGSVKLAVWRSPEGPAIERLDAVAWNLMQLLEHFSDFEMLCGEILARHERVDLSALLTRCIQRGWIDRFSLPAG